jgi:hypothetical protein
VVQFRAIDRRRSPAEIVKNFEMQAEALKRRVYEKIANAIVDASPVDTGTYIMAHSAAAGGRDEGFERDRSSKGKLRGRNPAQFKNIARGNLMRSVAAIPVGATDVYFRNRALHAPRVEYLGWTRPLFGIAESPKAPVPPYHVYARARAQVGQFIREAAAETGMQTR